LNARCAESNSATKASDGVDFAVGTMVCGMVWALVDHSHSMRVQFRTLCRTSRFG
jgi:hypothetical protein